MTTPLDRLKHHVSGAIARGEAKAIVGIPAPDPRADEFAGYHSFHAEPLNDGDAPEAYGSFEVFWSEPGVNEWNGEPEAGWYWQACFPGCMPDGEPCGPFATSREALADADEWNPEFGV